MKVFKIFGIIFICITLLVIIVNYVVPALVLYDSTKPEIKTVGRINTLIGIYYEGELVNGRACGKGILYFKNGNKAVDGLWRDNRIYYGDCKLYSEDGRLLFEGNCSFGEIGTTTDKNPNYPLVHQVSGFFNTQYYVFDGTGTAYDTDGNVWYTGEWRNGMFNGQGTLYDESGNAVYEGEFINGDSVQSSG